MSASVTTDLVAKAAQVHASTISRWVALELLPKPQVIYRGKRGKQTRWPAYAPEQAAWVKSKLEAGLTFEEIRAALAAGEFTPSSHEDDAS